LVTPLSCAAWVKVMRFSVLFFISKKG
jgi:hypothetical protein